MNQKKYFLDKDKNGFSEIECIVCMMVAICFVTSIMGKIKNFHVHLISNFNCNTEKDAIQKFIEERIISLLNDDYDSPVDSNFDDVWKFNNVVSDGFLVEIDTDSGKLDFNFCPKEIFDSSHLYASIDDLDIKSILVNEKEKKSFYISFDQFLNGRSDAWLKEHFTLTNYVNCNFVDFDDLNICFENMGFPTHFILEIKEKLQEGGKSGKFICSDYELRILFGVFYDSVKSYINWKNTLNVNFIKDEVLTSVLEYLKIPASKIDDFILLKKAKVVENLDLERLFNSSEINKINSILGFKNNDYRISIKGKFNDCTCYIKRSYETNLFYVERFVWK